MSAAQSDQLDQPERPVGGRHRAGRPEKVKSDKAKPDKGAKTGKPPRASKQPRAKRAAKAERPMRVRRAGSRAPKGALLTLLALAVICGVAALLLQQFRPTPAKQVEQARTEAVKAARDDVVDILSYNYQHINQSISKAKSEATGQFLTDYTASAKKVLVEAPAVKAEVSATVAAQAVVHAQADRVTVIVYVDQDSVRQLTGQKAPSTSIYPYRVQMTMSKVKGHWLVSDLQPE